MSKQDLFITVNANGPDGFLFETEINLVDLSNEIEILELLQDESNDKELGEVSEYEIADWQDVPDNCQDIDTAIELAEYYGNGYQDLEVYEAAKEAGIDFEHVEEAYSGSFDSDEDFAQDMAESLGAIDKNLSWPYTCIDWEQAAKELMYDYSESNGHYFRNF